MYCRFEHFHVKNVLFEFFCTSVVYEKLLMGSLQVRKNGDMYERTSCIQGYHVISTFDLLLLVTYFPVRESTNLRDRYVVTVRNEATTINAFP